MDAPAGEEEGQGLDRRRRAGALGTVHPHPCATRLVAQGAGRTRTPAPVHYARDRPEQTTLYRLIQEHVDTFFAQC